MYKLLMFKKHVLLLKYEMYDIIIIIIIVTLTIIYQKYRKKHSNVLNHYLLWT